MRKAIQKLQQHRSAVITLAHLSAKKAVKRQLQARGAKLGEFSARDIAIIADAWFDAHRNEQIAEAEHTIATSPYFARWRCPVFEKITKIEHSPNANSAIVEQFAND
jgi:hypothetical protein